MIWIEDVAAARDMLRGQVRFWRLKQGFTQRGLAARSGVALSTLRKFELDGMISLASYLKLLWVLGGLDEIVNALEFDLDDGLDTIQDARAEGMALNPRQRRHGRSA